MCLTQTQQVIIDYTLVVWVLIRGSPSFHVYNIPPPDGSPAPHSACLTASLTASRARVCSHTSLNSLA